MNGTRIKFIFCELEIRIFFPLQAFCYLCSSSSSSSSSHEIR